MLARLGRVLYWTATAIAIPTALYGVVGLIWGKDDTWGITMFVLLIAGLVWLAGKAVLYIFSGD